MNGLASLGLTPCRKARRLPGGAVDHVPGEEKRMREFRANLRGGRTGRSNVRTEDGSRISHGRHCGARVKKFQSRLTSVSKSSSSSSLLPSAETIPSFSNSV